MNDDKDLVLTTHYRFMPADGKPVYFNKDDLESFQYGDLVYLKDSGRVCNHCPAGSPGTPDYQ